MFCTCTAVFSTWLNIEMWLRVQLHTIRISKYHKTFNGIGFVYLYLLFICSSHSFCLDWSALRSIKKLPKKFIWEYVSKMVHASGTQGGCTCRRFLWLTHLESCLTIILEKIFRVWNFYRKFAKAFFYQSENYLFENLCFLLPLVPLS